MAVAARHGTSALLRAHLSAAAGFRHVTRLCPVCCRLLRLAIERTPESPHVMIAATPPATASPAAAVSSASARAAGARTAPQAAFSAPPVTQAPPRAVIAVPARAAEDESPGTR